jgi:hypothetical protein
MHIDDAHLAQRVRVDKKTSDLETLIRSQYSARLRSDLAKEVLFSHFVSI